MIHRYQLTLRPFSFCTVPKGYLTHTGKDLRVVSAGYYGSICYENKLTDEQVEHFDLKYLGPEEETK